MWSAAVRQNHGASLAQYNRSRASFVVDEKLRVDRQSISELAIEPASTSPFVRLTLFLALRTNVRARRDHGRLPTPPSLLDFVFSGADCSRFLYW